MKAELPVNEILRLKALQYLAILDSSRDLAFCARAILSPDDVLVVEDATKD